MRVTLTKGDMVLELDPCAGGAVRALRCCDLDILRPGPERIGPAFDPVKYAAFPMVPFVGRIHNGAFDCNGDAIELPENMPPEPHAIHGHGWRAAWKLISETEDTASLVYDHTSDAWPWDYTARQDFKLNKNQMTVRLSITNMGMTNMPAGVGWHPYFPRENAILTLPTVKQWVPNDETGDNVPIAPQRAINLSCGETVEAMTLDTTFSVSEPDISITWPTHAVRMVSDPVFAHATVYVPPGEDYFCAEPITHAPNAVNSALPASETGLKWLAPGETLTGSIVLSVTR